MEIFGANYVTVVEVIPILSAINVEQESTLCSKKSDAKIQITITTAYLIRIKYLLSGFNYHFFRHKRYKF